MIDLAICLISYVTTFCADIGFFKLICYGLKWCSVVTKYLEFIEFYFVVKCITILSDTQTPITLRNFK